MATQTISLKSLAEDKSVEGVNKTTYFKVDPRLLREEDGFNLRDYDDPEVIEHIEGFADSYTHGRYVPPLVVRTDSEGNILVIEGHCRRRGALLAIERGAELVSVDTVPFKGNDAERVEVMLRSAEGLKLKPLAVALGYLRLNRMGHSNGEIATRMRKTASHVEQMLLLANADHDVHKLVREGKVAAYAAIEAIRVHREKAGEFLLGKLEEATGRGKTAVTRGAVKGWTPPRKIVTSVIGSVETVVTKLDKGTRRMLAEFEGLEPAQLEGKKIEVDAASFLELVKAHGAVTEAKAAKDNADAAAVAAASQQHLDMEGEGGGEASQDASPEADANAAPAPFSGDGKDDPLYDQALKLVIAEKRASISLVQRHLRIGYNRAARLLEAMEQNKAVSPMGTNGDRKVLAKG